MDITKARKLDTTELDKEIIKTESRIVELRAEIAMHRIKNWHSLKSAHKYLARLLTIKKEHEIIKALPNEQV